MALSPMMQHYLQTKEEYPDAILFYRLGDFYEMFFEDAKTVSRELELTLTGKDCGLSERAPMCGVPHHAVETYLQRLIDKGYKVAICEQLTDPSKGPVQRGIVRVVTPGTVIEGSLLEDCRANYILCVRPVKNRAGLAFCDVSTGEFYLYQIDDVRLQLQDELAKIAPAEICVPDREAFLSLVPEPRATVTTLPEDSFNYNTAAKLLKAHFGKDVAQLGFEGERMAVSAGGALLGYLVDTQKNALAHIVSARRYESAGFLALDRCALRNLELTESARDKTRKGSLLWVLDRTSTTMGGRLMRAWIEHPLRDRDAILRRQDAVEAFINDPMTADALREELSGVYDAERLLSKIAYETANGRDALAILSTLEAVRRLRAIGEGQTVPLLAESFAALDDIPELCDTLRRAISPDAPVSVREGGIIAKGYNAELDELRDISVNAKQYLAELEVEEREKTGIKNLRISYNHVFGYYIEVTKAFYGLVPNHYVRKQTLANSERFITQELKQLEGRILGAEDSAVKLEYELFCDVRARLKEALPRLQRTTEAVKTLDVLLSLAMVAQERGYTRPSINTEGRYEITEGRHPVVEESLGRDCFVPNDTHLSAEHRVMIITGPNMAGKSTYMRQVAIITLMAHIGSFVPARAADISLTDRVFTRIGASDDLYGGQSTFMVEMSELATILRFATKDSLIILDEVGRGTSTFDGLSIAWAAVEYIAGEKCGARTLFATHYHELSELEGSLEGVVNYRVTAKEQGEDVIFLRKVVPGGEDRSYGVSVARLAGMPKSLIARARRIMARLEVDTQVNGSIGRSILEGPKAADRQLGLFDSEPMEFVRELAELDVTAMTPIEALNRLYEINEKAKRI